MIARCKRGNSGVLRLGEGPRGTAAVFVTSNDCHERQRSQQQCVNKNAARCCRTPVKTRPALPRREFQNLGTSNVARTRIKPQRNINACSPSGVIGVPRRVYVWTSCFSISPERLSSVSSSRSRRPEALRQSGEAAQLLCLPARTCMRNSHGWLRRRRLV